MNTLPYLGLGLGMTMQEAVVVCKKILNLDPKYAKLDFFNLGFFYNEEIPPELPELLEQTGMPITLHAVDINFSEEIVIEKLKMIAEKVKILGIKWVVEDLGIWVWGNMYLGSHQLNPIQNLSTAKKTVANIKLSRDILGCDILVENAPAYFIQGDMNIWDYLWYIASESQCSLALDVGHMMGLLINSDNTLEFAPNSWPGWSRVNEIHLSGFELLKINNNTHCLDSHHLPFNKPLMNFAKEVVLKSDNLKSILLELEYADENTVEHNMALTIPLADELRMRNTLKVSI